ncbi:MAG TPA: transglycosylase family protein [Candidatus Saccharimonadia bacterium]
MRRFALMLLLIAGTANLNVGKIQATDSKIKPSKIAAVAEAPKEAPQKHVVAAGESLSSIATDKQLESWRPLWNANTELQNPDQINPGQELIIPKDPTADRPLPPGYGEPVAVAAQAPAQQSYRSAPQAKVANPAPSGDILSRIRMRESGGNYATNTGNGYYGAYQYDVGTWNNYGGYRYASDAPPAVQDAKAAETYARRGCSPWPSTCY